MKLQRLRTSFVRPADNTAYTAGDEISNSATAASVIRPKFEFPGFRSGSIRTAAIDLAAASGNVVTTVLDLELLLFYTDDVPAAVGDNITSPIDANIRAKSIGYFRFDDTAWTGPLGTVAAGTSQFQQVTSHMAVGSASPTLQAIYQPGYFFNFDGKQTKSITAVLRALSAWTPTGIENTFGISLTFDAE
jgi:hypothetical protein